jgi:hypothetical protein
MRIILTSFVFAAALSAQSSFTQTAVSPVKGGVERKGLVALEVDRKPVNNDS